jgi:hypothetical protein
MQTFKLYFDKDAEEKWLQEMSLNGWGFKKFFLGVYTFESCSPGEYQYQLDFLDNWKGDKRNYSSFMEDVGIEVVGQWWRWVYLRKKTADGPFELYTDAESKIQLYRKIRDFFIVFSIIELICFFMELAATIESGYYVYGIYTILLAVICIAMIRIVWKSRLKIMEYKREAV